MGEIDYEGTVQRDDKKNSCVPTGSDRLIDFFQYLCQAVTKVDRCAMVVSLLASDPEKSDPFGKALIAQIFEIFNRQREEGVQPVQKEDVAEVLRRRFFETASILDTEAFRPHVTTAVLPILMKPSERIAKMQRKDFFAAIPSTPI